mgnify:CR=1 FL=1
MKNYPFILTILILTVEPIFCDYKTKGLSALNTTIKRSEIYDNSWAVIIGINEYNNIQDLQYAKKDATDFKSLLINKFDFKQDNIFLLLNEKASLTNINHTLSEVASKTLPNDRLIIFF